MISRLVAGRAGELTNSANPITFSLLEYIFGQNGPYRLALKEFGVKVKNTPDSYLLLKDSQVLTDLDKEQTILWGNYPIELLYKDNQVYPLLSWKKMTPLKILNYFNKATAEGLIINNINEYVTKCRQIYKTISEQTVHITQVKELKLKDFGKIYKDIVYVSYLYELISLYNANKVEHTKYKEYIHKNDFLMSNDRNYIEFKVKLPNGFYLDDYPNLQSILEDSQGLTFVPAKVDDLDEPEIVLQCLKNNLRLKTDVLMFFLNMTAQQEGHLKGYSKIADAKISDLI